MLISPPLYPTLPYSHKSHIPQLFLYRCYASSYFWCCARKRKRSSDLVRSKRLKGSLERNASESAKYNASLFCCFERNILQSRPDRILKWFTMVTGLANAQLETKTEGQTFCLLLVEFMHCSCVIYASVVV